MGLHKLIASVGLTWLVVASAATAEEPGREIPAPFAPFEYLVGNWKGTGVPAADKFRGWEESQAWAWKFEKGIPSGLTVTSKGDKVLAKGQLVYDPAAKRYLLSGTDAAGKPVSYAGTLDTRGKMLTLDRVGTAPDGSKQRLTLTPNANSVRYTLTFSKQEPGAPQFKKMITVGVLKEGEAFAAGSAAENLPKCIVTGGAATQTVSYQGVSYPLCCSGCRDEFNDNPEKYIKKLAMRSDAAGKPGVKPATVTTNKDDGTFEGLGDEPKPAARSSAAPKVASSPSAMPEPSKATPKTAGKPADLAAKAASLLKLGQNLEKSGKTSSALSYYRRVVKEYPGTPAAKTASERVKALAP